ncbi:hypothetical protein EVAR_97403_1 [Eumeta japonica]|uniref:Uncharacterized protein n=1 Tax=Eumeta variegata TaxID=151549 RepID=A0A4C1WZ47_EUMVA|nr:hypothetical protein EVAR_97403_1 [Eumeta japonica]
MYLSRRRYKYSCDKLTTADEASRLGTGAATTSADRQASAVMMRNKFLIFLITNDQNVLNLSPLRRNCRKIYAKGLIWHAPHAHTSPREVPDDTQRRAAICTSALALRMDTGLAIFDYSIPSHTPSKAGGDTQIETSKQAFLEGRTTGLKTSPGKKTSYNIPHRQRWFCGWELIND